MKKIDGTLFVVLLILSLCFAIVDALTTKANFLILTIFILVYKLYLLYKYLKKDETDS
jgi:hypothetical protein